MLAGNGPLKAAAREVCSAIKAFILSLGEQKKRSAKCKTLKLCELLIYFPLNCFHTLQGSTKQQRHQQQHRRGARAREKQQKVAGSFKSYKELWKIPWKAWAASFRMSDWGADTELNKLKCGNAFKILIFFSLKFFDSESPVHVFDHHRLKVNFSSLTATKSSRHQRASKPCVIAVPTPLPSNGGRRRNSRHSASLQRRSSG